MIGVLYEINYTGTMEKQTSRDRFIGEVVNLIASSDSKEGAFIFGLSGKWGEGKSRFLSNLRGELEKCETLKMGVVELNPWKFAHADNSIFRELLRQIADLHDGPIRRYYLRRKLDGLYHDISKSKIDWKTTLIASGIFLLAGLLYKRPPTFLVPIRDYISQNKALFTLLLIPALLGVANAVTTSQSSTKAVSTRDKFDDLIKEVLRGIDFDKIVVYVDDLDRLTATKALQVLDSLRTFFDNKKLIFVVASDHTVLERHLGLELVPGSAEAEQMDEGRRYLKKIFNVYWRLPIPTKPEFELHVKGLVDKEERPFLFEKLTTNVNRKSFRGYLLSYFSNNYRNVERFISRVEFTFRLIETQYTSPFGSKRNKEYFGEMLANPILVVRVLLIEELANPLFEKIQHNPELLLTLEGEATEGVLNPDSDSFDDLSAEQKSFMVSFINEKPRFRDEEGVKVQSIEPYIFLSSDSSFGDIRGLSPSEFISFLNSGKTDDLASILSVSGEQKLKESMDAFSSEFALTTDLPSKQQLLSSIILVANKTNPKLSAQSYIISQLLTYDLSFISQLTPAEKIKLTEEIGSLNTTDEQLGNLINQTPVFEQMEWASIAALANGQPITLLTQYKFLNYFKEYSSTNPSDALTQIGPYLDQFSETAVSAVLEDDIARFISNLISDNNDTRREYGLSLLTKTKEGIPILKQNLTEQLNAKNAPIFNWLVGPAKTSSEPIFSATEIVDAVLLNVERVNSAPDLMERIALFQTFPEAKDRLWESLLQLNQKLLMDALYEGALISSYLPLAPTSDKANEILEMVLRSLINKNLAGTPEAISWLQRITPSHWVFANLKVQKTVAKLIDERLRTKYLTDEVRQNLERIKNEFQEE